MIRFLRAAALCAFVATPALAGGQDFTLVNRTGYDIRKVHVSPSKSEAWGRDRLGTGMLHVGNQVLIGFKPSATACIYDVKAAYTDDDTAEWTKFDLCEVSKIKLYYDKKTGEATAEYE